MTGKRKEQTSTDLADFMLQALTSNAPPELPQYLSENESAKRLYDYITSLRKSLYTISHGNLDATIPLKGFTGGTIKTLQANLRNMIWQTSKVAEGDFSHRVEFMGEFASSFNAMASRLEKTLEEYEEKKTRTRQTQ